MLTFSLLGLYILIVVISLGYSVIDSKFEENTKHITTLCETYNQLICTYVSDNYGAPLETIIIEHEAVQKSVAELENQLRKLA